MKTSLSTFFSILALAAAGASDKAPKKVDMVAQKRVQYGRVLYPPQERGFTPDAWIAKIESPDMTRGEFGLIEDLLDARSRLPRLRSQQLPAIVFLFLMQCGQL